MKKLVLAIALVALGTTMSFAQNAAKAETAKTKTTQKVKKAATAFECPMHCTPATDHAGKCSKCKMDLVEVKPKAKKP
jgi:Ni/Co efflux regulator RcnB